MKQIIILHMISFMLCNITNGQKKAEMLRVTHYYNGNTSGMRVGCSMTENEEPLKWAYEEYKRTGKKVKKVRFASDVYKYFKKEEMIDSFFINPSTIKPEHEILLVVPFGIGKKYIDCNVISMKYRMESKIWKTGCASAKTISDFITVAQKCPTEAYMWSHEIIKRYKTNFAGLIKMLQKRELLLVKRSSSISPHVVVNTEKNYYDIKIDKNQRILL
jgi:hypothetical protein